MRICSIASGSSGNCIYVGSDDTHLLIDCGISGKRIEKGLNALGLSPKDIDAVLVTHEHADHINGLGVISRRYELPVYTTEATFKAAAGSKCVGEISGELLNAITPDRDFAVGDLKIHPFSTSHDAADPVGFRVSCGKSSMAVATDMGTFDEYTIRQLLGLDVLFLEANHDVNMLEVGRYPYPLKQRILSDKGHLSNEAAGHLLNEVLHDEVKHVFLGHLSAENNYPALAFETVCCEITRADTPYKAGDFDISVAKRDEPGMLFEW